MIIAKGLYYALSIFCMTSAFWPYLRTKVWWIRIYEFPRLQMSTILAICLLAMPWVIDFDNAFDYLLCFLTVAALILNFCKVYPYMAGTRKTVPTVKADTDRKNNITLFIGNVKMENTRYSQWAKAIVNHNADVVFMVETCAIWCEHMQSVREMYPHKIEVPLQEHNGMLFYSKIPIRSYEVRYLVRPIIPSLRIVLEDGTIIYGLHPRPPRPQNDADERDNELEIIADEISKITDPVIVAGDLNDVGWSHSTRAFLKKSRLNDPRRGRGLYNSFHAQYWFMRWPLDHLFVSNHFGLVSMKRLRPNGSDHFPISICLKKFSIQV